MTASAIIPLRILKAKTSEIINKPLPIKLTIALTFLCNSRCKTCNIWKIYKEKPNMVYKELPIATWLKLLNELRETLIWLEFTGGEPFLKNGIDKILVHAFKNTSVYAIGITTNAVYPEHTLNVLSRIINEVPSNKQLIIGISIDGTPDLHDEIRGIKGNFERAIYLYRKIKMLREQYKNIHVHFSYTVSQYNAGRLKELYEYLRDSKIIDNISEISITIEHYTAFYNRGITNIHNSYRKLTNDIKRDIENYIKLLRNDNYKNKGIINSVKLTFYKFYARKILNFITNPRRMIIPCVAGKFSAYIDPYGNVYPCTQWLVKLGNIKKQTFKEIWFSKKTDDIRKSIAKGECPNCWTPCEAQPSWIMNFSTLLSSLLCIR